MQFITGALVLLAALAGASIVAGRLGLLQGSTPGRIGLREGRLAPPSRRPNCVSSQADLYPDHPRRAYASIQPLSYSGGGTEAIGRLKTIVESMPGASVVRAGPDYLYATFTTRLMRFVDDVEFALDPTARVIHVRSASRVGYRDRGVNRARVEAIRARLEAVA